MVNWNIQNSSLYQKSHKMSQVMNLLDKKSQIAVEGFKVDLIRGLWINDVLCYSILGGQKKF